LISRRENAFNEQASPEININASDVLMEAPLYCLLVVALYKHNKAAGAVRIRRSGRSITIEFENESKITVASDRIHLVAMGLSRRRRFLTLAIRQGIFGVVPILIPLDILPEQQTGATMLRKEWSDWLKGTESPVRCH